MSSDTRETPDRGRSAGHDRARNGARRILAKANAPHKGTLKLVRTVITGAAGFIGSHLADALVARGYDVMGIDCFTDTYDEPTKRANVERVLRSGRFRLI